jgi:cyclopropane-fatty-acyl-phospholipid synthase
VRDGALGKPDVRQVLGAAARLGVLGLPPAPPPQEARLRGGLHTLVRDRAAISHHYDLGNDFYELVLDEQMAYSCGWWATPDVTHEEAQRAKLDMVCRSWTCGRARGCSTWAVAGARSLCTRHRSTGRRSPA